MSCGSQLAWAIRRTWRSVAADRARPQAPPSRLRHRLLFVLACIPRAGASIPADAQVQQVSVPPPRISLFRYRRAVTPAAAGPAQACAVLDGTLYAHAEPALGDLRLYAASPIGPRERPYALTSSRTAVTTDQAQVLNPHAQGDRLSFDLAMPARPYTDVDLDLGGRDFIAEAQVSGRASLTGETRPEALGSFTLFDLSAQGLSRATVLPLRETAFAYLHVELRLTGLDGRPRAASAELVRGASVPPSREAQALYTTVAQTSGQTGHGGDSVFTFQLPARVPVEQIEFALAPGSTENFRRAVRVVIAPQAPRPGADTEAPTEQLTGELAHVQRTLGGHALALERLRMAATVGLNVDQAVTVTVTVENGAAAPLPIRAARLQMRQRRICFDVPQGALTLFYGADDLDAPQYDYPRSFDPAAATRAATLAPEAVNPAYRPAPPAERTRGNRHPERLWFALASLAAILGLTAIRSLRQR